ncbi:hypothetical protein ALC56_13383 [Trachymyrmex septentrionalis]|uniref:Uncharacterized protein n=1 Tax=Trachymyrmex septentrionalis TaxID=34720 RepID=A0A195EW77_9HYME|nr:hypothetical protein ALC56_13383 [Trachymyrmex septentrionalis]
MGSRFSFLPYGDRQPYRCESPYTVAMCKRRKSEKEKEDEKQEEKEEEEEEEEVEEEEEDDEDGSHRSTQWVGRKGGWRWADEEVDEREEKESPSVAPEGNGQATTGRQGTSDRQRRRLRDLRGFATFARFADLLRPVASTGRR